MILNYLGSKVRTLPYLHQVIDPLIKKCTEISSRPVIFGDLFAGSGVVSQEFAKHPGVAYVVANDQELYSYIILKSLLTVPYSSKLLKVSAYLNSQHLKPRTGLITRLFSPYKESKRMFFTIDNARKIDACRRGLHELYARGKLSWNEFLFLLSSLISSVSRIANNTSCFRAYLKTFSNRSKKNFQLCPVHTTSNSSPLLRKKNIVVHSDVLSLSNNILATLDIVYLDPPYSSNHYGSYYGFYNYLAIYNKSIKITGIAGVPADYKKSAFGMKQTASRVFKELVQKLVTSGRTKYIVLSYNEDGVMSKHDFYNVFKSFGNIICYKLWNRKFRPSQRVTGNVVKDYIMVLHIGGVIGKIEETWLTKFDAN